MKKQINFLLFLLIGMTLWAQKAPKVPSKMQFAGMSLNLNKAAQKKIQESVDKLCKNPIYFQKYVDQANVFFPLIERVFQEEGFPDEIKYLIIQESAFRAEAVSSSNAVGYWQFKKATAIEVGLVVGRGIDERKNIERASRGAATYMTRNNTKLDNWVHALTSYNTGLGGVQKYVSKKDIGTKKMTITGRTHWYFLKFLAHKVAFENAIKKQTPEISLIVDKDQGGQKLKKVAKEYNVSMKDLVVYNKWIGEHKKIPTDRKYTVVIPVKYTENPNSIITNHTSKKNGHMSHKDKKDIREHATNERVKINDINAIRAIEGDNAARLAIKGGITRKHFLKYNELQTFDKIEIGEVYFIHRKKGKAPVAKHIVQEGETVWQIAQKYGMRSKSIRSKNRMRSNEALIVGRVLWMRTKRPSTVSIEFKKDEVNENVDLVKKENQATNITEVHEEEMVDVHEHEKVEVQKEVVEEKEEIKEEVQETKIVVKDSIEGKEEIKEDSVTTNKKIEETSKNNNGTIIHTVEKGETLYAVSKKYKVSVSDILEWNNLNSASLSLGQKLLIHKEETNSQIVQKEEGKVDEKVEKENIEEHKKYVFHIVQKGDTIYSISKRYKITPVQILEWNNKVDYSLSIGEKLIVKKIK